MGRVGLQLWDSKLEAGRDLVSQNYSPHATAKCQGIKPDRWGTPAVRAKARTYLRSKSNLQIAGRREPKAIGRSEPLRWYTPMKRTRNLFR